LILAGRAGGGAEWLRTRDEPCSSDFLLGTVRDPTLLCAALLWAVEALLNTCACKADGVEAPDSEKAANLGVKVAPSEGPIDTRTPLSERAATLLKTCACTMGGIGGMGGVAPPLSEEVCDPRCTTRGVGAAEACCGGRGVTKVTGESERPTCRHIDTELGGSDVDDDAKELDAVRRAKRGTLWVPAGIDRRADGANGRTCAELLADMVVPGGGVPEFCLTRPIGPLETPPLEIPSGLNATDVRGARCFSCLSSCRTGVLQRILRITTHQCETR